MLLSSHSGAAQTRRTPCGKFIMAMAAPGEATRGFAARMAAHDPRRMMALGLYRIDRVFVLTSSLCSMRWVTNIRSDL